MTTDDRRTHTLLSTLYSVVIPVYNSEDIVDTTIDRVISFFEGKNWSDFRQ